MDEEGSVININTLDDEEFNAEQSAILEENEETPTTPNSTHPQRYSRFLSAFHGNTCNECGFTSKGPIRANNAQRHIKTKHPIIYHELMTNGGHTNINDIKRNFVLYAATTTFPMSHVENHYFKKIINGNNDNTKIMTRKTLQNLIMKESQKMRVRIKAILKEANHISLSADIMTTRGMRFSYLGVIAHAWYCNGWKSFALEHVEMNEKHQSGYIRMMCERVINNYEIPVNKIVRIVTDSAANMKAAFINPFGPFLEDDCDEEMEEVCTLEEMTKYGHVYEENLEKFPVEISPIRVNFGHTSTHISCAAHRLQLVLKDAIENNPDAILIKKKVFSILGKFMKSHNATRDLFMRSGKKLLFPAITRWSSLHITYERFLELSVSVNIICKEKNWPVISDEEIERIKAICELFAPFRGFTNKLQSDNIPTISLLYPGIHEIIRALEKSTNVFKNIREALINSIKRRFSDVLNSGFTTDPIFLISFLLDPSVAAIHSVNEQVELMAKCEIKRMCLEFSNSEDSGHTQCNSSNYTLGFNVEYSTQTQKSTLETEIYDFFQDRGRPSFRSSSPAIYWIANKKAFPSLTILANKLFCIPATSASVERLFSQTTLNTSGHKSQSGPETTMAKVLLNFNKHFIV